MIYMVRCSPLCYSKQYGRKLDFVFVHPDEDNKSQTVTFVKDVKQFYYFLSAGGFAEVELLWVYFQWKHNSLGTVGPVHLCPAAATAVLLYLTAS